jgi:hypothetical protein
MPPGLVGDGSGSGLYVCFVRRTLGLTVKNLQVENLTA